MQQSVLVVEDDEVYRELVERHLGEDYVLLFAHSLQHAREVFENVSPDCVILDMRLPDGNGISFIPMLEQARIPVIMFTAHGNEEIAVQALKAGADDYLVKESLSRKRLRRSLRYAFTQSQSRSGDTRERHDKERLANQIHETLENFEQQHGILPICANCKSIRDGEGRWQVVENFLGQALNVTFSHGLCPMCLELELNRLHEIICGVPESRRFNAPFKRDEG